MKYTFLFLASFVQARLLPAQAEKASRACTQFGEFALRAKFTPWVKCIAHPARCIASRALCTAHHVLCIMFCAPCIPSSDTRQMSDAPRIVCPVRCTASGASRFPLPVDRPLENAAWGASSATCRTQRGECDLLPAERIASSAWHAKQKTLRCPTKARPPHARSRREGSRASPAAFRVP